VIGRKGCIAVVLVALWLAPAAGAADPSAVYTDFGLDGKLSCKYTRAELQATLNDATINEYGDPYAIAGLKAAIRRQLAGGCARSVRGSVPPRSSSILIGGGAFLFLLGACGWAARRAVAGPR
jgi:hypothetical protein